MKCKHCQEVSGFYLGMTCSYCKRPFRNMINNMENKEQNTPYQELFNHMENEHGKTLLITEMMEIVSICSRVNNEPINSGWVSVREKMPDETHENVLVSTLRGEMGVINKFLLTRSQDLYWMPLPAKPPTP
jgi:hypothetical protein